MFELKGYCGVHLFLISKVLWIEIEENSRLQSILKHFQHPVVLDLLQLKVENQL